MGQSRAWHPERPGRKCRVRTATVFETLPSAGTVFAAPRPVRGIS
jgi:hypothetical protein